MGQSIKDTMKPKQAQHKLDQFRQMLSKPKYCENTIAIQYNIPVCVSILVKAKPLDKQHRYLGDIKRSPSKEELYREAHQEMIKAYAENHPSEDSSRWEEFLKEEAHGLDDRYSMHDVLESFVKGFDYVPSAWTEYISTKDEESKVQRESAWARFFNATPYTTFWMVDYLLYKSDVSYADLLDDPKTLRKGKVTNSDIQNSITEDLSLLSIQPGRCTSFAIQVSSHLEELPHFDFEYYDLNGHRVARCKFTGILIDSAWPNGPVNLPDGKKVAAVDDPRKRKWSYESGSSTYSSKNRRGDKIEHNPKEVLSPDQSMEICLRQLASEAHLRPLCLFRSATPSLRIRFHGMIKWKLQEREVQLIQDLDDQENENKLTRFVWNGENEENMTKYSTQYSSVLARFIFYHGGPMANWQWDTCCQVFQHLWTSACMKWGFPQVDGVVNFPALPQNMWFILDRAKKAIGNVILDGSIPKDFPNFHWLCNLKKY